MDGYVKYSFGNWDNICDSSNMCDILHLSYMIDTTSNDE